MNKAGVLVYIDDDQDDLLFFREAAKSLALPNEVKLFASAQEALGYLKLSTTRPFMVISDLNMPIMTGFELRREVLEDEALSKKCFPYLFLSTSSTHSVTQKAYEYAIQGFFQKPNDNKELKTLLKDIYTYWIKAE